VNGFQETIDWTVAPAHPTLPSQIQRPRRFADATDKTETT
jgi:hypothetical protein